MNGKKDKRIKVIHVENGGAGKARNIGIMNAQGEYFAFVDSDDYLEMHMYEHLYEMLNSEVDIAECEIVITDIDEAEFEYSNKFDLKTYTRLDAMQLHIQNLLFNQTPVNKLYKKR